MSLDVLRSLGLSPGSRRRGSGLTRTARLFIPSYNSRIAIRVGALRASRSNTRRELARLIGPNRRSS